MPETSVYIKPSLSLTINKTWFVNTTQKILSFLNIAESFEIGLVITNSLEIKRLNNKYRNKNSPTDVLAFSMVEPKIEKKNKVNFIKPPDGILHLGEVLISYPQAVLQANEHNHTIERELQILMIHGLLHLLGYDHELSAGKARIMMRKEEQLLKMLISSES